MNDYKKIIKRLISSKVPKRFRDIREYLYDDEDFRYNQTTVKLFNRNWRISGYLPNAFVVTNFSADNTMNTYIEYNTKQYLIHKRCKIFDGQRNVTDDEAYKAKAFLLWLIYFYYARH